MDQPTAPVPGTPESPQPQSWAWARPAPQVSRVETPPLEYHQLMRGVARYRWWKPLLAVVLGVLYYLTLSVVYTLLLLVPMIVASDGMVNPDELLALAMPDTQQPLSIVLALGSVALMLPAALLAMLSVGLTPARRLWSVALRIRWRWIGRTIVPAIVALVVMNVVSIVLGVVATAVGGGPLFAAPPPGFDAGAALISIVLVLVLVPVQATAEELVYRGLFMQSLGAWLGGVRGASAGAAFLRGPWLPIAIPALAFGFSHIYDIWGFLSVTGMAVAMGWISWRTGGLEAAISLHVVNNLVAFGFLASALGGETGQTASGGDAGSLIGTLLGLALYAWWVDRDFRRRDGRRTRIDVVEGPPTFPPAPTPPAVTA